MNCRFCGAPVTTTFVDLGMQPLSNAYVRVESANAMEPFFPLHPKVCGQCFLVQLPEIQTPEQIFSDYAYLSSMSDSWLAHARRYAGEVTERFKLGPKHLVIEVASNDGYLLRFFKERQIPVLGIEPAANVAAMANAAGIPSLPKFFGSALATELVAEGKQADLLVGNNVLAHVPNLNDFVRGLRVLLAPTGVLTMEFPHLGRLLAETQFDTIYHEHFSYLSLGTTERVFGAHGLVIFDVELLATHGGSLRVFARHERDVSHPVTERVGALRRTEETTGLNRLEAYAAFSDRTREVKRALLELLVPLRRQGKHVIGYGAAAKGNTLLNYCGIRTDFLDYIADRSPTKQGKMAPGTRVPIVAPERIRETRPDYVLLLPWNIKDELTEQLAYVREWGGRFLIPIPRAEVLP